MDGAPVEDTKPVEASSPNTTAPFMIGGAFVSGIGASQGFFDGLIDDVQIYGRPLSDSEIDFLFQNPGQELSPGPVITTSPQNIAQAFGGKALFSVTATGSGTLTYQWKKNTVDITGATSAALILTNLQAGDAGSYTVVVTDTTGSTTSQPATLTVTAETMTAAGLVAHWKFDEAPGSPLAVDSVGNYNGLLTTNGVAFVTGGRSSNAVSLTAAANGLVNMGNNLSFTTQDFTVVAWIKTAPGDTKTFANFLSKHEANFANGYILSYNHPTAASGANHAFLYASSRTLPNGSVDVPVSTTAVNDGNWHLIVGVYQASGNTSIYVDGSPAQGSITSTPLTPNTAPFLIGGVSMSAVPTAMYSGLVDDVQIYKRVLADSEIDFLYQNPGLELTTAPAITLQPADRTGYLNSSVTFSVAAAGAPPLAYQWFFNSNPISSATNTSLMLVNLQTNQAGAYSVVITNSFGSLTSSIATLTVAPPLAVNSGLVAYYPFNGNPKDVTGNGANGTPSNVGYGPDRFGFAGAAAGFAGDFTSYSDITSTNLNLTQDFTISAWFNFTANAGTENPRIISSSGYVLATETTAASRLISFANYGVSSAATVYSQPVPAGTWIHAVGVRAAGQLSLYVNGSRQGTPLAASFPLDYSRGLPEIGGNFLTTADNFAGSIDDLRIYNRALNSNEVAQLFQLESSPTFPALTNQPQSQAVAVGSNVTFSASAVGAAPLTYQWYFNGTPLPGATTSVLTVPGVTISNVGN